MAKQFIDLTPSWEGLIPAFIAVLQDGNSEGKKIAKEELRQMARAADMYNKMVDADNAEPTKDELFEVITKLKTSLEKAMAEVSAAWGRYDANTNLKQANEILQKQKL